MYRISTFLCEEFNHANLCALLETHNFMTAHVCTCLNMEHVISTTVRVRVRIRVRVHVLYRIYVHGELELMSNLNYYSRKKPVDRGVIVSSVSQTSSSKST